MPRYQLPIPWCEIHDEAHFGICFSCIGERLARFLQRIFR